MPYFRFIHAADLHLDSPLVGLTEKSEAIAESIENASRQAFDNLISLARDEQCSFIVIAGDLFDGQWRDYRTGLFFADRMRKLRESGIRVFIVLGNHDAENKFRRRIEFSENVRLLSASKAESLVLEDLGVVIHGQSYPRRDVSENLAVMYPAAHQGFFNIGVLHTACTGREGHELYAPCSIEDLLSHGYDYWALGHIHKHEVLNESPPLIFAGNLQGRHVREAGPKGVVLVTVDDGNLTFEHRPLDVIRWSIEELDASDSNDIEAIHELARDRFEQLTDAVDGRALAIRIQICGRTSLHPEIVKRAMELGEELRTIAQNVGDIWLEKIEIKTSIPERNLTDPTMAGRLQVIINESCCSETIKQKASDIIAEVRRKTPHGAADEDFYEDLAGRILLRASELAKATVGRTES